MKLLIMSTINFTISRQLNDMCLNCTNYFFHGDEDLNVNQFTNIYDWATESLIYYLICLKGVAMISEGFSHLQ